MTISVKIMKRGNFLRKSIPISFSDRFSPVYTNNLKYAHFCTSALELQKFRLIPGLVFSQTLYLCWMHKGLNYNLEVPLCSCNYLHFFYTVFYFY